jgi:hypothetical protein
LRAYKLVKFLNIMEKFLTPNIALKKVFLMLQIFYSQKQIFNMFYTNIKIKIMIKYKEKYWAIMKYIKIKMAKKKCFFLYLFLLGQNIVKMSKISRILVMIVLVNIL